MRDRLSGSQAISTCAHTATKQREDKSVELSAAEEYAIRIIAAESALQHAARDEAPAARLSSSPAGAPDGEASSPALVAGGTDASRPTLAPGGTATTETNHPAPIPLPVSLLVPPIPDGLWPAVRSELEAQSVIGYPANAIESLGLSPADQAEYLARAGKNLSSWYRLMMAQDSVLAEFRQAGIPVAVLKGAAAAANYPQPNSRSMGDIDLIVPPDHFEQAFSLMERLGWENDIELEINPRHAGFKKAGCPEIELHRYFSTCTNKQQAHFLDQAIYDAIPRAEWTDVAGFSVPVLPPLENGLVLLAHVNQHLGSGLGLRQILDWQMFVDAQLTDELWERGFQHAAQQIGMEKLAVTTTWLCRTYLGLQTSATWFGEADAQLASDLLLYIMQQGNMGRKMERGAQATRTVLHNLRSPAALVHYLYEGGRAHWAPARKHAWLAPAACLYQVGHVIRKGLSRNASMSELVTDARSAQEDIDLLKRLEVTRM